MTSLGVKLQQAMVESEEHLEKEFAKLPAMADKTGREVGVAYQRSLREIEKIKPMRSKLEIVDALIENLEQSRRNLLGEISDIRSARTAAKQRAVERLNKRLSGKLRITIVPDGLREPLRKFLQCLPGIGPQKTRWIDEAEGFSVPALASAIRTGGDALLGMNWGLTSGVADALTRLTISQIHELEIIDIEDRMDIELNISRSGSERFQPLERLSTGQQCTAILHLLLLDNRDPLIMDQPEDNLDNAFIAERIVKELLSAKTERQFLFATHNANIPVFGDAEWIGVCGASGDRAEMPPDMQGSEESGEVDAFMRRVRSWHYPIDALREAIVNALAHRDWSRFEEAEVVRYADRLVVTSPGTLPNTMTVRKMIAGQRSPRNPLIVDVLRDYGYVDARGMGVRNKIIPLLAECNGVEPDFHASEDHLVITMPRGSAQDVPRE